MPQTPVYKWGPHCPFSLTYWIRLNDCGPLTSSEMVRYKQHRSADMARYQEHVRR